MRRTEPQLGFSKVLWFVLSLVCVLDANAQTDKPAAADAGAAAAEASERLLSKPPELKRFVVAKPGAGAPPIQQLTPLLLELTVQADGHVTDVVVLQGADPILDEAAISAVKQFLFVPAEIDGQPRAVRIRYEYVYEPTPSENENAAIENPGAASRPSQVPAKTKKAAPTGRLTGRLLQSGTRKPILGAEVRLPELGLETLTDGEGRFTFDEVDAGRVQLRLTDPEHTPILDTEEVRAAQVTDVTYYAEQVGFGEDDLVAIGQKEKKQVVRRTISARELATVPGSNGDAMKAVQNLPGVARTTGEQVVLRGETAGRVLINGHPITSAFHFGGLRSTVANGLIGSLEVTPGNYDVAHGNTNAGIVEILTRRPAEDALHGYVQVDLFDASLFLEGPVSEHATVAIGGRRSYIDAVLHAALSDEDKEVFRTAPRYYDYQGAYDWQKGRHRLRFNVFGVEDRLVLYLDEPPESEPSLRGELGTYAQWVTGQALWDYRVNEYTQLSNSVSYLRADFDVNLGGVLRGKFVSDQVTWRSELKHELSNWLSARAGLHARVESADLAATAPRGTEEGEPPPVLSNREKISVADHLTVTNPALYVALDLKLGPLLLVPGLRVEHFSDPNMLQGKTLLQPHLDARVRLTPTTSVKAGVGLYSRNPDIFLVHDGFGNAELEAEQSVHYSAGIEQRLGEAVSLDAVGFYKHLYHQISAVADPAIQFDNRGKGRVYGAELLLKHDAGARFYGWAAYTLTYSERRESGENQFQPFQFDQPHNLNLVGQYRISRKWELGARFRYISGNPRTPVVAATYDSDADIYTPTQGPLNSARNAAFHQLDLRVDRHWVFDTWKLTAYLDVQNVYNRQNPDGTVYNFDYSQSEASTGLNLPLIPSFGVKGEF